MRCLTLAALVGLLGVVGCCHDTCDSCRHDICSSCGPATSVRTVKPTPAPAPAPAPEKLPAVAPE